MNTKIKCLIDGGFISAEDVIEHAAYLENQMNDYYDRYAEEQQLILDEELRATEEMYNSGEDLYGQDEPDEEYDYPFDLGSQRSDDPEYIIASTSYKMEETYLFEANKKGEITNFGEYGGLCYRYGDKNWNNRDLAVESVFPGRYQRINDFTDIEKTANVFHSLYKKITNEKN
jgi:hypothetical protein